MKMIGRNTAASDNVIDAVVALPGLSRLQDPPERELEITYVAPDEPPAA